MKKKRITKGKALIEARKILGPSGHVRFTAGLPSPCIVGTFAERWRGVAVGKTWGEALEQARVEVRRKAA